MPVITLTKPDYDEVVWPAVAMRTMGEQEDLAVAESLVAKLEAMGAIDEEQGSRALPTSGPVDVDLTDDEAELLDSRLEGERRRHATARLRSLFPVMLALKPTADAVRGTRAAAPVEQRVAQSQEALNAVAQQLADLQGEVARTQDEITRERERVASARSRAEAEEARLADVQAALEEAERELPTPERTT